MHPLIGLLIAYLAGSVPFAYLAGKARGIDLREHGSGNLGSSNAVRVLGKRVGAVVYIGDTLKGLLPVVLLPPLAKTDQPHLWAIGFGVAAVLGHVRPIYLLGKGGGKGVATAGGVFLGLAWLPTLVAVVVFFLTILIARISSVASLLAAISLPIAVFFYAGPLDPLFALSVFMMLLVIWTHRSNIDRLRRGEEPRVGRRVTVSAQ